MYLSAACRWGIKHRLVSANPFDGMAAELPKHRYQTDPNPNAFSEEETAQIIERFKGDKRKGMNYRLYAPFVEFLFGVGCRPSEAIGLQWKHISQDCGLLSFEGSLVQIGNRRVRCHGSKNNRTRKIAASSRIQALLLAIRPEHPDPEQLVFPSSDGDSINYRNFARRAWSSIVDPIKEGTTPYSCRDTFITTQLIKGVPSSVIAKWCDTSTQMIDHNYADKLKLSQLRPKD
jgi:integrase